MTLSVALTPRSAGCARHSARGRRASPGRACASPRRDGSSTVFTLIPRAVAIALLLRPSARSWTISRSRVVSASTVDQILGIEELVEQGLRDLPREERPMPQQRFDGGDDMRRRVGFEEIPARAGGEHFSHQFLAFMHRENKDLGLRQIVPDAPRRLQPVQLGHRHVEHDDIGFQFQRQVDGFAAIRRLAHDLPSRLFFQEGTQAASNDVVIVRQKQSGRFFHGVLPCRAARRCGYNQADMPEAGTSLRTRNKRNPNAATSASVLACLRSDKSARRARLQHPLGRFNRWQP